MAETAALIAKVVLVVSIKTDFSGMKKPKTERAVLVFARG
jgi:hypothetical protein